MKNWLPFVFVRLAIAVPRAVVAFDRLILECSPPVPTRFASSLPLAVLASPPWMTNRDHPMEYDFFVEPLLGQVHEVLALRARR